MRRHLSFLNSILLFRFATLFAAVLCLPLSSRAAFQHVEVGARPAALGGAYCALSDDAHGPLHNPAGAGWMESRTVALSASRPFGLSELDTRALSILQPICGWILGLHVRRFGGQLYCETTVGMSAAHRFLDGLSVGWCFRGLQLAIREYGSDITWCLDLGLIASLTQRIRCGISARNLNDGRLGVAQEGMPQILIIGLACRPHDRVLLSLDLLEDHTASNWEGILGGYPLEISLGQEFHLLEALSIRTGLRDPPVQFSAGLGLKTGPLRLDYAFRSHQFLGGTHSISLTWP